MPKFRSSGEFEKKLIDQLEDQATHEHHSVDQVKHEIAYERFLARMDTGSMTLKGGYAVKSQVPTSPYTKDIDLILIDEALPSEKALLPRAVRDVINEQLDRQQLDDYFRFDTGEALGFQDLEPTEAGARLSVRAYIGNSQERFVSFPLDVAITTGHVLPPLTVTAPNHLAWAEIEAARVSVVPPEYLFADKLLIYVESRNDNRVGDLAHMVLLAEKALNMDLLAQALSRLAARRKVESKILQTLIPFPKEWAAPFHRAMSETKSDVQLEDAFELIKRIHEQLVPRLQAEY